MRASTVLLVVGSVHAASALPGAHAVCDALLGEESPLCSVARWLDPLSDESAVAVWWPALGASPPPPSPSPPPPSPHRPPPLAPYVPVFPACDSVEAGVSSTSFYRVAYLSVCVQPPERTLAFCEATWDMCATDPARSAIGDTPCDGGRCADYFPRQPCSGSFRDLYAAECAAPPAAPPPLR